MLHDEAFCFEAVAPQTRIERVMETISKELETLLDGGFAADHVSAELRIDGGRVQLTVSPLTPLGIKALRAFSGEG